jgi:spore germination protein GerM
MNPIAVSDVNTPNKWLFLTAAAFIGGGLLMLGGWLGFKGGADRTAELRPETASPSHQMAPTTVHLYFANRENAFLIAEKRELAEERDPGAMGRRIVENLIEGPRTDLVATLPAGTRLEAIHVTPDRTAYVDFSRQVAERHPGGVLSELLSIYAVVNSLVLNVPEIEAVKILVDGGESTTLAGHIDLTNALKANMLLIR